MAAVGCYAAFVLIGCRRRVEVSSSGPAPCTTPSFPPAQHTSLEQDCEGLWGEDSGGLWGEDSGGLWGEDSGGLWGEDSGGLLSEADQSVGFRGPQGPLE
uniref:Uncharacterized protein n=1 Tax=Knipowitschia caucasica TaxID=637954 RepID=A0AAV2LEG9_KNICA